jgi:2-iminobutanoate/2-iminopropanoate deaminase
MVCAPIVVVHKNWLKITSVASPTGKCNGKLIASSAHNSLVEFAMELITGLGFLSLLAILSAAQQSDRKHIVSKSAAQFKLPFSDAVLVGSTLYVAGHIGLDAQTGKPPATAEQEAKLVMDGIKETVEQAGMTMDNLVSVQVFCSDLRHFEVFNTIYRTYFREPYPARAFLGSGPLLLGARFEVMGIAVRQAK